MRPPYSCAVAGGEAQNVDEGDDRDIEAVAEARRRVRETPTEAM